MPTNKLVLNAVTYLINPNPNINTQTMKIPATMAVNLLSPFSALFWEVNICAAFPIPAMPSPFGECISIKTIKSSADITCVIQTNVSKINLLF